MVEEMLVHEVAVALGVVRGQSDVFVEVEGMHIGKVDFTLLVPLDHLAVESLRGGSRGQPENLGTAVHDPVPNNLVRLLGDRPFVLADDNVHSTSLNLGFRRVWSKGELSGKINFAPALIRYYWTNPTKNQQNDIFFESRE